MVLLVQEQRMRKHIMLDGDFPQRLSAVSNDGVPIFEQNEHPLAIGMERIAKRKSVIRKEFVVTPEMRAKLKIGRKKDTASTLADIRAKHEASKKREEAEREIEDATYVDKY